MYTIDDWFPGFTLFVLVLAPIMIVVMWMMMMVVKYFDIRFNPVSKTRQKVAKWLNYAIAFYMVFPLYDIALYFMQMTDSVSDRLFSVHIPIITMIVIFTKIGQVICYASNGRDNVV